MSHYISIVCTGNFIIYALGPYCGRENDPILNPCANLIHIMSLISSNCFQLNENHFKKHNVQS